MNITILTIFPEIFPGILNFSITGKALKDKKYNLNIIDIKKYGIGKHHKIDDKTYGGGGGMLMRPDVLADAIDDALKPNVKANIIYPSPRGNLFSQNKAIELSKFDDLIIICGRFEGIDQRVIDYFKIEEISIGDYILTNGELAAFAIIDSIVRLLPQVITCNSLKQESFGCNEYQHLLEYPQYTKPLNWNDLPVPDVLLSGNHKQIDTWRVNKAKEITQVRRDDLWKKYLQNCKKH